MLPISNVYNKKTMGALPGAEQILQSAHGIEKQLHDQKQDLSDIRKQMKKLSEETADLSKVVDEVSD